MVKRVFLAYINDLPDQVRSRVRLFADGTAMYLALDRHDNFEILQKDLESLEKWEKLWNMSFNPSKCQVIHVTRRKNPFKLNITFMAVSSKVSHLKITLESENLKWTDHINDISKKANQTRFSQAQYPGP